MAAVLTVGASLACGSFDETTGSPTTGQDAATTPDAALPGDGGPDASPALPFCAGLTPKPAFCKDFDDGKPHAFGFIESLGDVALDDASFVSSPSSMRTTGSASGAAYVRYRETQNLTKTQRLAFDVFVGARDGTKLPDYTSIARIREPLGADCSLSIFVTHTASDKSAIFADEADGDAGRTTEKFSMSAYPVAGKWSRVEVVLEQELDAVVAGVTIDGVSALARRSTLCPSLGTTAGFDLGAIQVGDTELRFDNVVWDGT